MACVSGTRHRFILRVEVEGGAAEAVERVLKRVANRIPGARLTRNDYELTSERTMRLTGRKTLVRDAQSEPGEQA